MQDYIKMSNCRTCFLFWFLFLLLQLLHESEKEIIFFHFKNILYTNFINNPISLHSASTATYFLFSTTYN